MNLNRYTELIEAFTEKRKGISRAKREDYTKGSDDVLANFKNVAESSGLSVEQVWSVYAHKHWDSIMNYVKSGGQSESEPIEDRLGDLVNYLEIFWGIINDKPEEVQVSSEGENFRNISITIPEPYKVR